MIKFFSFVAVYLIVAFGLYGYNHANNTFMHIHNDGKQCTVHNTTMSIFWPITYPVYGIYKGVSEIGDFSISLFTPIKAEKGIRHE